MSETELAWAAGLFEGEGTVRINKPSPRNWGTLCVSVTNTDVQVLEWFQARWPGHMKPVRGLRPDQKDAWTWVIAARKAATFLEEIRPYIVRDAVRARIEHGLDFQGQKRNAKHLGDEADRYAYAETQWNAYWWMCHLNQRGRPQAGQHRRRS